ncbi:hypothetical protein BDW72DRAFT_180395 [Aspergillus terricola var. indicus]
MRYKCQACYDFNYCAECFIEATLTHPGHEFRGIGAGPRGSLAQYHSDSRPAVSAAESVSPDETKNTGALLIGRCRPCAQVSLVLPALDITAREIQNETRQKLDD